MRKSIVRTIRPSNRYKDEYVYTSGTNIGIQHISKGTIGRFFRKKVVLPYKVRYYLDKNGKYIVRRSNNLMRIIHYRSRYSEDPNDLLVCFIKLDMRWDDKRVSREVTLLPKKKKKRTA